LPYGRGSVSRWLQWLRGPGRVLTWAAFINLVYIWGKRYGQYGLMKNPAYSPVFSWQRFLDFQERYLGNLFYHLPRFDWPATCLLGLLVPWSGWRRPRRLLRFCWFWAVLTPLPIMFIENRDQACLYVTLGGWGVLAVTLFLDLVPAASRVIGGEP